MGERTVSRNTSLIDFVYKIKLARLEPKSRKMHLPLFYVFVVYAKWKEEKSVLLKAQNITGK